MAGDEADGNSAEIEMTSPATQETPSLCSTTCQQFLKRVEKLESQIAELKTDTLSTTTSTSPRKVGQTLGDSATQVLQLQSANEGPLKNLAPWTFIFRVTYSRNFDHSMPKSWDRIIWDITVFGTEQQYFLPWTHIPEKEDESIKFKRDKKIKSFDKFLEANKQLLFIVFRDYVIKYSKPLPENVVQEDDGTEYPATQQRSIFKKEQILLLDGMIPAMAALTGLLPGQPTQWWHNNGMRYPYLPFFHYRHLVEDALSKIEQRYASSIKLLLGFINSNYGSDYDEAQQLLSQGIVSGKHFSKLYRPDDILVTRKDGTYLAYLCHQWPYADTAAESMSESYFYLNCSYWSFNGSFGRKSIAISVEWPLGENQKLDNAALNLADLPVVPIRFVEEDIKKSLEARGRMFWACRRKKYITYHRSEERFISQGAVSRLMIDYETYKELHPEAAVFRDSTSSTDLPATALEDDEPPAGSFIYLLPHTIDAFAIQEKKWKSIFVEHIRPVHWNKTAFDRLVLKPDVKELIEALVRVHISAHTAADIIDGKGSGLIILLHGAPGTGKTLTAESVAELAEKPLYRVTCGDIGTDAEGVEQYLESVLYVGNRWDCVVLLDEADVFLEERSLTDLQRNALVSVFLRVLEYYEGILILTSNRVGTFDEAFKSRIKLALHYQALTKADRKKVWRNFIKSLRGNPDKEVDYDDLDDHLDDLAEFQLNGREIRNAVGTAGELSQYRKEVLSFRHFQHVIKIAGEFDTYLEKTHGHSDSEWARSQGTRY